MDYAEHLVSARQIKCSKGEHDYQSVRTNSGWCVRCQNCHKPMTWADSTPAISNTVTASDLLPANG